MKSLAIFALCLFAPGGLVHADAASASSSVSGCGQTVSDGVLASDLDCSASQGFAVVVADGGVLHFAGHRLVSGPTGGLQGGGVLCLGDCSIQGEGGSLENFLPFDWNDADTQGSAIYSSYSKRGKVTVADLTVRGYAEVATAFSIDVEGCTLLDNNAGISARSIRFADTTLSNSIDWGYYAIGARSLTITDSTIEGGAGVQANRLEVYRSTVTGMHDFGVSAFGNRKLKRFYAEDSTIDGNCAYPSAELCGDVVSTMRLPVLVNTTCSRSLRYFRRSETWGSWGICRND